MQSGFYQNPRSMRIFHQNSVGFPMFTGPVTSTPVAISRTSLQSDHQNSRMTGSAIPPNRSCSLSIRLELVLVVDPQCRVLLLFPEIAVADGKNLDVGTHESAKCILGRPDHGLAAHVEAGIDQHAAARQLLEC